MRSDLRFGEGRLYGAAWTEPQRGDGPFAPSATLKEALAESRRTLQVARTAERLQEHAGLLLALGQCDRAVAELSEATDLDDRKATTWSDLAAAHLQRGLLRSDSYEFILSLSAANRAIRRDPSLLAARFNRAVALGHLSLGEVARADWRFLLARERDPGWCREAKVRNAALTIRRLPNWEVPLRSIPRGTTEADLAHSRQIVAGSPQRFREHVEEVLLPAWAQAELERRDSEAKGALDLARTISAALVTVNGDRIAADTIVQIDRLKARSRGQLRLIAGGLAHYGSGLALAQAGDFSHALKEFRVAREMLAAQQLPFAGWSAYQVAVCLYQQSKYQEARVVLGSLVQDQVMRRYKALHGRSLWLLGLMDSIEGRPTAALTSFEAARNDFNQLKEKAYVAKLSGLLAVEMYTLGQRKAAWRLIYPALVEPETLGQRKIRSSTCNLASLMASQEGEMEIALWFQDEVVRNAFSSYSLVEALRNRVSLLSDLGRSADASRDLAQARVALKDVSDLPTRQELESNLLLAEANLALDESPERTVAALDKAIPFLRETSYHFQLAGALYQRATAEIALGRDDVAERDLKDAISEFEQQRVRVESSHERTSYFDRTREILDALIALLLGQGRTAEALLYSERAKARVLWDWLQTLPSGSSRSRQPATPPVDPRELESLLLNLPSKTTVLYFTVLPESTSIWLLRLGQEPIAKTIFAGERVLDQQVALLRQSLLGGRMQEFRAASANLYDELISPMAPSLIPGERLVVVPDRALHRLAFSLLWNRRTRRFLVQDQILSVAPSLRFFEEGCRRVAILEPTPKARALVVTDPGFDRSLYPLLSELPARATGKALLQHFPGSQVLQGEAATQRAFLERAGGFEIVHFEGHSVINTEFPLLSQMLFATATDDPGRGVLYSRDILNLRFQRTRLVVLASCNTAEGKVSHTEGVENLARPFLAAGVSTVVAALWKVDDRAASEFFSRFYSHLGSGFNTAEALRATQLAALEQSGEKIGNPRSWGAFEAIGGCGR